MTGAEVVQGTAHTQIADPGEHPQLFHPSHAPGFLPPIVTEGAPETAIHLDAVACLARVA